MNQQLNFFTDDTGSTKPVKEVPKKRTLKVSGRQLSKIERDRTTFKPHRKKGVGRPEWEDPCDIAHPLDQDIVQALRKSEKGADLVDLFSEDLDPHNGVYHFRWSDQDIIDLWKGIIELSLNRIYECNPESEDLVYELVWWESLQCKAACHLVGLDYHAIKPFIEQRYGRPTAKQFVEAGNRSTIAALWQLPMSAFLGSKASDKVWPNHDVYD